MLGRDTVVAIVQADEPRLGFGFKTKIAACQFAAQTAAAILFLGYHSIAARPALSFGGAGGARTVRFLR
jgi:hypothetical protein